MELNDLSLIQKSSKKPEEHKQAAEEILAILRGHGFNYADARRTLDRVDTAICDHLQRALV